MPKVTVIYDTSYLMNGQGAVELGTPDFLRTYFQHRGFPVSEADYTTAEKSRSYQHIIPTEVKQEIARHLASDEKARAGRVARGKCAEIMALTDYKEVSLAGIPILPNRETLLGPDSKTDKGIVALARQLAATDGHDLVYVASDDGGIQGEVSLLHSQDGLPVYSPATESDFLDIHHNLVIASIEKAAEARSKQVKQPAFKSHIAVPAAKRFADAIAAVWEFLFSWESWRPVQGRKGIMIFGAVMGGIVGFIVPATGGAPFIASLFIASLCAAIGCFWLHICAALLLFGLLYGLYRIFST